MYEISSKGTQHYCTCEVKGDEKKVQPKSVVLTPQQALDMANENIPISSCLDMPEKFFDGYNDDKSNFVESDRKRGADLNDLWNEEVELREKHGKFMSDIRKKHKEKEGE